MWSGRRGGGGLFHREKTASPLVGARVLKRGTNGSLEESELASPGSSLSSVSIIETDVTLENRPAIPQENKFERCECEKKGSQVQRRVLKDSSHFLEPRPVLLEVVVEPDAGAAGRLGGGTAISWV